VREAFLALALESELDKPQLLDLYLSEVYLGSSGGMPIRGVEQAARAWFGKSAASLTIAEAATIAGAIASPYELSPLPRPSESTQQAVERTERARRRRDTVLDRMVAVRALTLEQATKARAEPLVVRGTPPSAAWRLPWAVDAALDEAEARLEGPLPPGAALHTTIQPHLQRAAERAVRDVLGALGQEEPDVARAEGALVAVDPSDGDVVAIVGGRDWVRSPFHRAIHAERQAGSTVKPLLLAAALHADPSLSLTTVFDDAPLERRIDGRTWRPKDHDGRFLGPITLRRGMEQSRNVPAVLLSERLGLDRMAAAFRTAGLDRATKLPSSALGAFPATALELAGAYTLFPGQGRAQRPHVVHVAYDRDERPLLAVRDEPVRVVDPASAALATSVLQGVLTHGTGRKVAGLGVAPEGFGGKTGTTDQGRDAWFVGFDARLVVAVWVGADRGDLGLGGSEAALPVWAAFVRDAGRPRGRLPVPDGVVDVEVCATTGLPACVDCAERRTERFRAGYVAASACGAPPAAPEPSEAPAIIPEEAVEAPAPTRPVGVESVRRGPRPRLPQRAVGEARR
jgi:membrane peptidoglycan carboxypeptidase